MQVQDLIERVCTSIRQQFYADLPPRLWHRDRTEIIRAIARYGYVCDQRGWHFDAPAILRDLLALLRHIHSHHSDINYFPVYLRSAIDRHLGTRAEELSSAAKALPSRVQRAVASVSPTATVIRQTDTEVLAALYRDQSARRRRARARRTGKQRERDQLSLL